MESFNGRVRDELLDVEQFSCLAEAVVVIEDYRQDYLHAADAPRDRDGFGIPPTQRNFERFQRLAFFDLDSARRRDGEWIDAFSIYTRTRAAVPHVKRTMRQLVNVGAKPVPDAELRRIEVPTTLLWGRHDRFVPLALADAASTRLGWSLHVIDEAGHVPHIERPESFRAALSGESG